MFKKWGLNRKNISKAYWSYIVDRLEEREAQGKPDTAVVVHGELVPKAKIQKQRRNYQMNTFERCQLST
jgi:hypothetical protein